MADNDQKTQDPTPKKLEDARKRGDVPGAPEMRHAAMFAGALIIVLMLAGHTAEELASLTELLWSRAGDAPLTAQNAQATARGAWARLLIAIGPMLLVTIAMAVLGLFLQGMPSISTSRLKLKWDRLSPMAGAKRLFGKQALVEFAKTLAKFAFVAAILSFVAWPGLTGLDHLIGADAAAISRYAAGMVATMVRTVAMLVGALALADFVYQRRAWFARMRMTLEEVKDEYKQNEGDPKIKARIRQIGLQRARRRMMAAVPGASVVVTNPTHYAVALKYDHGAMRAPVVVAKGTDRVALKIREVAEKNAVPVVESPPLARALYATVEIDQPIKVEQYAAVAEIISYVMKMAGRRPPPRTGSPPR